MRSFGFRGFGSLTTAPGFSTICVNLRRGIVRRQRVGHGLVVDGFAKFQGLKFTFQGLNFQ